MFCPECGTRFSAIGASCEQCGAAQPDDVQTRDDLSAPQHFAAIAMAPVLDASAETARWSASSSGAQRAPTGADTAGRIPLLSVRNLDVLRPDGTPMLSSIDFDLAPGEVVVLLGGSGTGKTTLGRALFEPERLRAYGFDVSADQIVRNVAIGLVPQHGALFDHLDVGGNIRLALRYAEPVSLESHDEVAAWLERVDLDPSLASPGIPVASLSGGQAQRVAVARSLASGRQLLFLDEPSVGLDPARVRVLAAQIRQQVEELGAACIIVTHDVPLATGVADRILLVDPDQAALVPLFADSWPGPFDSRRSNGAIRKDWQWSLEEELVRRLSGLGDRGRRGTSRDPLRSQLARASRRLLDPFSVAPTAIAHGLAQVARHPRDYLSIFGRVFGQACVRPLPFYIVVAILLGYTVLYVIVGVAPAGVRPDKALALLGSSHIVALVPPLGAFLFAAASGNAVNGWLGGMSLTKQIQALEALGIARERYLWAPAWTGLGVASIMIAVILGAGMTIGGYIYCATNDIADGWSILTTDFADPRPERVRYLVRAGILIFLYAWGMASDVVAAGTADKIASDDVTRSMTGSVVRCTLWVVSLELITTMFVMTGSR